MAAVPNLKFKYKKTIKMKKQIKKIYDWLGTAGKQFGDTSHQQLAIDLVDEEVAELKEAIKNKDLPEIMDAIVDIHWVTMNVAFFHGINLDNLGDYFNKVDISNNSKFCRTVQERDATLEFYKKEGVKVFSKEHNGFYVILRLSDQKIMKNINYKKVADL